MNAKDRGFKIGDKVIAIVDVPRQNVKTGDSFVVKGFSNAYLFYAEGRDNTFHIDHFMTKEFMLKIINEDFEDRQCGYLGFSKKTEYEPELSFMMPKKTWEEETHAVEISNSLKELVSIQKEFLEVMTLQLLNNASIQEKIVKILETERSTKWVIERM